MTHEQALDLQRLSPPLKIKKQSIVDLYIPEINKGQKIWLYYSTLEAIKSADPIQALQDMYGFDDAGSDLSAADPESKVRT